MVNLRIIFILMSAVAARYSMVSAGGGGAFSSMPGQGVL
jgi:hypothetical protein